MFMENWFTGFAGLVLELNRLLGMSFTWPEGLKTPSGRRHPLESLFWLCGYFISRAGAMSAISK